MEIIHAVCFSWTSWGSPSSQFLIKLTSQQCFVLSLLDTRKYFSCTVCWSYWIICRIIYYTNCVSLLKCRLSKLTRPRSAAPPPPEHTTEEKQRQTSFFHVTHSPAPLPPLNLEWLQNLGLSLGTSLSILASAFGKEVNVTIANSWESSFLVLESFAATSVKSYEIRWKYQRVE